MSTATCFILGCHTIKIPCSSRVNGYVNSSQCQRMQETKSQLTGMKNTFPTSLSLSIYLSLSSYMSLALFLLLSLSFFPSRFLCWSLSTCHLCCLLCSRDNFAQRIPRSVLRF